MNKSIKKNYLYVIISVILIIVALIGVYYLVKSNSYSNNKNPYPELRMPSNFSLVESKNFKDLPQRVDAIFVGTITEVFEEERTVNSNNSFEEKLNEKFGKSNTISQYGYKICAETVIKGDINQSQEVVLYISELFVDSSPKLEKGDRMVFFIEKNPFNETYIPNQVHESYFYITEQNTVYPASYNECFKQFNGMPLDKFIKHVKKVI